MLVLASECINMSQFLLKMPLMGELAPEEGAGSLPGKGYHPRLQLESKEGLSCKWGWGVCGRGGQWQQLTVEFGVAQKALGLGLKPPRRGIESARMGSLVVKVAAGLVGKERANLWWERLFREESSRT